MQSALINVRFSDQCKRSFTVTWHSYATFLLSIFGRSGNLFYLIFEPREIIPSVADWTTSSMRVDISFGIFFAVDES